MTILMAEQIDDLSLDDLQLVQEAITDADAFAQLYHRHVTCVYRYHIAYTGNVKDAEGLTSQTFMSAMQGLKSFWGDGSFAAWIMGIASKKRLMYFRGRRPEVPLEAALHYSSPSLPTDKAAIHRLKLESIARALKQISPERVEAITLAYFGGLSNNEIGQVLRKSEGAVKMLISRGLQDLRERTSLALEVELRTTNLPIQTETLTSQNSWAIFPNRPMSTHILWQNWNRSCWKLTNQKLPGVFRR